MLYICDILLNVQPSIYDVLLTDLGTDVLQLLARLREDISGNNGITVFQQVSGHGSAHVSQTNKPHWCF